MDNQEENMDNLKDKFKQSYNNLADKLGKKVGKIGEKVGKQGPFKALEKDAKLGRTLHSQVISAMNHLQEKQPNIKELLDKAYGYAVVPSVGRASAVLGGAYGVGEVFVKDRVKGYAAIVKLDIGVQLGGTNFHEMIVFNDKKTWEQFKTGKYSFSADAGVAIVKASAQASKGFGSNTVVFVFNEGGMLLDLGIGLQRFIYKPTVLGKMRTNKGAKDNGEKDGNENSDGKKDEGSDND